MMPAAVRRDNVPAMDPRDLTRPAARREAGHFLAEGPHLLEEALAAGAHVAEVHVARERAAPDGPFGPILRRAVDAGARIRAVSHHDISKLADTDTPQGIVSVVRTPAPPEDPFAVPGLWVVLDGVQDPGNVGTLLRSAEAFGARGAIQGTGTADAWGGKVLRSAQGAHFRLVLIDASGPGALDAALDSFAAKGGAVWGAAQEGDDVYSVAAVPPRLALVLGSEARGISDALRPRATRMVSVPQRGRAESLNVAMAGSILLSWLSGRPAGMR
ncbi:MAG: putative tRNA/rRNA methyltransferase [Planctomycetes bacterium]|nr:putative tRNA/rRNA methyltransferase [Planctomycetota bacterium]